MLLFTNAAAPEVLWAAVPESCCHLLASQALNVALQPALSREQATLLMISSLAKNWKKHTAHDNFIVQSGHISALPAKNPRISAGTVIYNGIVR